MKLIIIFAVIICINFFNINANDIDYENLDPNGPLNRSYGLSKFGTCLQCFREATFLFKPNKIYYTMICNGPKRTQENLRKVGLENQFVSWSSKGIKSLHYAQQLRCTKFHQLCSDYICSRQARQQPPFKKLKTGCEAKCQPVITNFYSSTQPSVTSTVIVF